jgi:hypothetical protein
MGRQLSDCMHLQIQKIHPVLRWQYRFFFGFYFYHYKRNRYNSEELSHRYKMLSEQSGGYVKHKFNGYKFKVDENKIDDNTYNIYLNGYNNPELDCVVIEIADGEAMIGDIGYFPDCSKPLLPSPSGGNILMEWTLEYLRMSKDRFHIKRILLQDNSKLMSKCKNSIWLALSSTLTTGHTWYGKYGFLPFDSGSHKPDEEGLKKYKRNIKIMKVAKLKDVDLTKLLKPVDKELANEIKNMNTNTLLKEALKKISHKDPCSLTYIYDYLMERLHLTDFTHKTFYLDL